MGLPEYQVTGIEEAEGMIRIQEPGIAVFDAPGTGTT
jgi:hypothetical protein